jgi:signal peptidase I
VAFLEPATATLSIKRVAATPGDRVPFRDGFIELADDEAWLSADATAEATAEAGFGAPIDSRRFGPVPVELLVGRVWFRYAPWRRIGRVR